LIDISIPIPEGQVGNKMGAGGGERGRMSNYARGQ